MRDDDDKQQIWEYIELLRHLEARRLCFAISPPSPTLTGVSRTRSRSSKAKEFGRAVRKARALILPMRPQPFT